MNRDPTHSEEIRRLQRLKEAAERRYDDAVERFDSMAAARAALDWEIACAALDTLFEQIPTASISDPASLPLQ